MMANARGSRTSPRSTPSSRANVKAPACRAGDEAWCYHGSIAHGHRTDDAPGVTTREVATAAIEHVRDALRNAVDSIEDRRARARGGAFGGGERGRGASASKAAASP